MGDREWQGNEHTSPVHWAHGALTVLTAASLFLSVSANLHAQSLSGPLPDAPSALLLQTSNSVKAYAPLATDQNASPSAVQTVPQNPQAVPLKPVVPPQPCPNPKQKRELPIIFRPSTERSCVDPLQSIVDTGPVSPLTVRQKGTLATRDVTDPFNLMTIGFFSAITIASNSHSAYGPGFAGWGRESGYSLAEDIQIEFTGTFLIPSLAHQDPRYHRMPKAPVSRRIEHALIHTLVSQHDDGSLMPNYATLINYPLSAEIANLYVPNVGTNASSTAKRVIAGFATDPIGPLVAEFLPDVAKRVHIHIIFVQQILNHMAPGAGESNSSF